MRPTQVSYKPGLGAFLVGGGIAFMGCFAGCCLIPCCMEDLNDAVHNCSGCGLKIGEKRFLLD
jgi:lipopolysaccharide-induced tumor necrosis factor-alpha factor